MKTLKYIPQLLALFLLTTLGFKTNAQITKITDLVASDPVGRVAQDAFGYSAAISGDIAVVTAVNHPYDETGGDPKLNAGAVYIFYKDEGGTNNWGLWKKIVPTGNRARRASAAFGFDVAIWGDVIVVGAPFHGYDESGNNFVTNTGAAFVFQKDEGGNDNWGQVKKLVIPGASERRNGDQFGWAVSVAGDNIVIGAPFKVYTDGGASVNFAGAAYLFNRNEGGANNWGFKKKFLSDESGNVESGIFGYSVAVFNEDIVISAVIHPYDNGSETILNAGKAHVYSQNEGGNDNWGLVKILVAEGIKEPTVGDWFGKDVAINGGTIVVGAENQDFSDNGTDSINNAGAAYIYQKNKGGTDNWGFVKKITPAQASDRTALAQFGKSVSISGSTIVVGAANAHHLLSPTDTVLYTGAAYVFSKDEGGQDNWGLTQRLIGSGTNGLNKSDGFGYSVAASGSYLLIGANRHDYDANGIDSINGAGRSTVFSLDNTTGVNKVTQEPQAYVAAQNKNIHLSFITGGDYAITVYDLMGRKITQTQTKGNSKKIINLPQVSTGYYIVKVSNGNTQQVFKTFLQ